MAEITNFEIVGSGKTVTKVEASLDGGKTYGTVWEAIEHIYTLVPTQATDVNGDGTQYKLDHYASYENIGNYWTINTPYILYEDGIEVDSGDTAIINSDYTSGYWFYVPSVGETNTYDDLYIQVKYKGKTIQSNPIQVQLTGPEELLTRDASIVGSSISLEWDSYGYKSETYTTSQYVYTHADTMIIYFQGTPDENTDAITVEDDLGYTTISSCNEYTTISDTESTWKLVLTHSGFPVGTESGSHDIVVTIPESSTYKSATININAHL